MYTNEQIAYQLQAAVWRVEYWLDEATHPESDADRRYCLNMAEGGADDWLHWQLQTSSL